MGGIVEQKSLVNCLRMLCRRSTIPGPVGFGLSLSATEVS